MPNIIMNFHKSVAQLRRRCQILFNLDYRITTYSLKLSFLFKVFSAIGPTLLYSTMPTNSPNDKEGILDAGILTINVTLFFSGLILPKRSLSCLVRYHVSNDIHNDFCLATSIIFFWLAVLLYSERSRDFIIASYGNKTINVVKINCREFIKYEIAFLPCFSD